MIRIVRDAFGHLVIDDGEPAPVARGPVATAPVVVPVRAFPLSAPDAGVSLVGADGRERCWIARPGELPDEARRALQEELEIREFTPVIRRIVQVDSFVTPCRWLVETDRGTTRLELKSEEDIRRLAGDALLITDARGVHYRIERRGALDPQSRRLLERFL